MPPNTATTPQTIIRKLNCKSKFTIYLMECTSSKVQHVGKAETAFNIKLNNHKENEKIKNLFLLICNSGNLGTHSTCMQNLY